MVSNETGPFGIKDLENFNLVNSDISLGSSWVYELDNMFNKGLKKLKYQSSLLLKSNLEQVSTIVNEKLFIPKKRINKPKRFLYVFPYSNSNGI